MTDFTTYTDTGLYAELAGRESTLGLKGMAARLNDREISKIRNELESRKLHEATTRSTDWHVLRAVVLRASVRRGGVAHRPALQSHRRACGHGQAPG
jgi:hypothetical protein